MWKNLEMKSCMFLELYKYISTTIFLTTELNERIPALFHQSIITVGYLDLMVFIVKIQINPFSHSGHCIGQPSKILISVKEGII